MKELINTTMDALGIPYEYWEWTSRVPKTYFTGEWSQQGTDPEAREVRGTFTLVGHSYEGLEALEVYQKLIYDHYKDGVNGEGYAVYHDGYIDVPTDLEGFYRIEIYLDCMKWS